MKKFGWIFMVMLTSIFLEVNAQQKCRVEGTLVDSLSLQPEPFATVRIYRVEVNGEAMNGEAVTKQTTGEPMAMGVSDMEGRFTEEVEGRGAFVVLFTSVGKCDKRVAFTLNGEQRKELGTIALSEDVRMLEGVEVVAQRPLVKMETDRMSYKVSEDVDARSSSVLDMLRKVPMVTVDGQDNITVNGSSNFKVYVDGKQNVMISSNPSLVLKNMPASAIRDIEVITNPGVRYDAEGVGGVLNLVTNRTATEGGTAAQTDGYNATLRGQGSTKGYGGGLYLNLQRGKFSMSLNANAMYQDIRHTESLTEREQTSEGGTSVVSSRSDGRTRVPLTMGSLTMGYQIDSLRLLSASFNLMGMGYKFTAPGHTSLTGPLYGNGMGYATDIYNKNNRQSINGSIDYQRSFAGHPQRMLTFSYLLSSAPTTSDSRNLFGTPDGEEGTPYDLTDRSSDGDLNTLEQTLQADFTTPLAQGQTLSTGVKYIDRNNSSDTRLYLDRGDGEFAYDPAGSLDYEHRSHILAGYAEYDGKFGRLGFKGGLRYEHTWQDVAYRTGNGSNFSLRYGNLVPSANLSYALSANRNIGLSYNMRIARPGITYLNPYVDTSDPTSRSYGNTELKAEKAHNVSLVYNYFSMKWMLNLTLRHSVTANGIGQYSFYEDGLLNTTYDNIVKNRQTGLNLFLNWNAGPKTRIYTNSSVSYTDLRSRTLATRNHGWSASSMVGFQQTLPADLRLSLNAMGSTRSYNLQGWQGGFDMLAGSLSKSFRMKNGNSLDLSLHAMTPLSHRKMQVTSHTSGTGFTDRTTLRIPLHQVGLSLSYTFGKQGIQTKKVRRSITNDDLINTKSKAENFNGGMGGGM